LNSVGGKPESEADSHVKRPATLPTVPVHGVKSDSIDTSNPRAIVLAKLGMLLKAGGDKIYSGLLQVFGDKQRADLIVAYAESFYNYVLAKRPLLVEPPLNVEGPIVAIKWHQKRNVFAVAHRQNAVYVYDYEGKTWLRSYLHEKNLVGITCLDWNPTSDDELVVGCATGVYLGHVSLPAIRKHQDHGNVKDKSHLSALKDLKTVKLDCPSLQNVSCIQWSPDGRFIVSGSHDNGNVYIFSIVDGGPGILLKRRAKYTQEIHFSPDGLYIALCQGPKLRIIETSTWKDRFVEYDTDVKNFNWFPDNSGGLFTLKDKCEIHSLQLVKVFPSVQYDVHCVHILQPEIFERENETLRINGKIRNMVLSPSGGRLLVSFEQDEFMNGSEHISVFQTQFNSRLGLSSDIFLNLGYIHGPLPMTMEEWESTTSMPPQAEFLQFQNESSVEGELALISWSNGRMQFFPFFYNQS
jgi:hypothetical protein